MKKTATILLATAICATAAAQTPVADGHITITDFTALRMGDSVRVRYTAAIDPRAVRRDYTLLVAPVITGEGYRQSLPALAVQGPGSRVARKRREIAYGTLPTYERATTVRRGESVVMTATVPFQRWMYSSDVIFESIEAGCCEFGALTSAVAARGILPPPPPPPPAPAPQPVPEPVWVPESVGDSLSTAFAFVVPYSQYSPDFTVYDEDRDNGLEVYFRLSRHDIDPGYLENPYNLGNLIGCINMIMASTDSRVEKIIVAGFASPEGTFEFNDRLAFDRAVALKRYIMDNTGITDDQVALYNGAVDWQGLRMMIARGTMPQRQSLLDVLDNTPARGRLDALRRFEGGTPYRYLQTEYFPWLRTGAFIKVFYENNNTK
jgi:outer membrane protein OmpA-like peptidoglycan-associated protein